MSVWSLDEFCTKYELFLDWLFEDCSHENKHAKKHQVAKRCDRIFELFGGDWWGEAGF